PLDEEYIIDCGAGLEQENGSEATLAMLAAGLRPDGIFAFCDPIAIGIMITLKKNNIKIPEEIAIVGFCDEPMDTVVEPQLSSLVQPAFKIGETAAQIFFGQIKNKSAAVEKIVLSTELMVRDSSLRHKN
ncbi:MAG: LacI family transcriptional regulator, partial [Adhaeribacter sp.]|nr:LacI family transcriptional regulator [Adhaeribacter sp.]